MPERFFRHPTALVETDQIGDGTNVWAFAHVMKGAVVGLRCNIGDHAFIETGAIVGDDVTIKNGVAVWQYVTVERLAFLGPHCSLTNDNRPRSKRPWTPVATTIREGATIGANATIVCGCHIGRYAFVGAGAVVTRPVPDYAVVTGVPARVRGYVCECCQPLVGQGARLTCRKCGLRYVRTANGVAPLAAGPAPAPGGPSGQARPASRKAAKPRKLKAGLTSNRRGKRNARSSGTR